MGRQIVVLDAPSNLGLRPPAPGVVPGVYKLAGALRDQGIVARLGAADGGVVTPPRYLPDADGKAVRNGDAIAAYARLLADRVQHAVDSSAFPLVLGGDCSILLGDLLALRRRGRYGLAFLDGHLDFRHPGNARPSEPPPARTSPWRPGAARIGSPIWRACGRSSATRT